MSAWTKEEMDASIKEYSETHPVCHISVDVEFVELGKWQNAYGDVDDLGGDNIFVTYFGTCPYCAEESAVSFIRGTYADPTYPPYCPHCGQRLK